MENYIFFRDGDDQTNASDAAMFPGASVMALQPGDNTGAEFDIFLEPRDCDVVFADGANAHNDKVVLTYPITMPFDEMCELVVERINAIGPFTVVADMIEGTLDANGVPLGGDANTPAMTGIQEVTTVAITSAE